MKKMDNRPKGEQLFILFLMFAALLGAFGVMGCGGQSCETPKCGSEDAYIGGKASGCSIPGCGGCLSSGRGCNSSCWPQSCKFVKFTGEDNEDDTVVQKISACDVQYYGDGCTGCGQSKKSCYTGCVKAEDSSEKMNGFFYGTSDSSEHFIGCTDGCGGCIGTGGILGNTMEEIEQITGVD